MLVALGALACGDSGTEPTDVTFGETTLVIVVNPPINDANDQSTVPTPGATRSGVTVSVQGGPSGTTDANGVVVLAPVEPGTKSISLSGGGASGTVSLSISDKDLREVAVALTSGGAQIMANVRYAFGGEVVEVTPSMSVTEVNSQLSRSNIIVFFKAGSYTGDLLFSGSNVTLFGEGTQGGQVTLNGTVEVGGSANRIRGARMTSDVSVPGSSFGFSFSRVAGSFSLAGSSAVLLNNRFCGTSQSISGSGTTALGNIGLTPDTPSTGC
ncbi:MAG TPA: hypothetical protein VMM12_12130 [Longimicrobiales bacterium]|nr:hypothetical protein [Longimicrobiales bacterium]